MKIQCQACKQEVELETNGPTDLKRAMPKGWRPRRIDGRVYNLCDVCGNISHFCGGLSAYLQENLGLPKNVEFDRPEKDDFSFWNPILPDYSKVNEALKDQDLKDKSK